MKYPLAEKFKGVVQGEGLYTGTPMAFLRFVGCSVGKTICVHCDTAFERMNLSLGGGLHTVDELVHWVIPYEHVCLTGGEPLDRDLSPLIHAFSKHDIRVHIETSGTIYPPWLDSKFLHTASVWLCVSPKPGWKQEMIDVADEVKVILGGLGDGPSWPTIEHAVKWADEGKLVFLQPRNLVLDSRWMNTTR